MGWGSSCGEMCYDRTMAEERGRLLDFCARSAERGCGVRGHFGVVGGGDSGLGMMRYVRRKRTGTLLC